ncbi:hypothetical protein [Aureimonas sp. AU20]|uniref:hypothetical protein n=1 Tax=Aureimonas sp. AU20 TaxID=1349819 RepID=UPI00071F2AB3|nr:hypothetical protein [Aureimonas sp. AU20]ALN75825.1 hypothetical protein M673_24027 [Aureimonas sp. AU20]
MAEENILDRVMSPSQVVKALGEKGIRISERALRERARRIGAFHKIGREILFTDEDLERIMSPDPKPKTFPADSDFAKRMQRRREKERAKEKGAQPSPAAARSTGRQPDKQPDYPLAPWVREKPKR